MELAVEAVVAELDQVRALEQVVLSVTLALPPAELARLSPAELMELPLRLRQLVERAVTRELAELRAVWGTGLPALELVGLAAP